jgi:hypothetical protein
MDQYHSTGLNISHDMVDYCDELADEFNTNRAAILRTLLKIGRRHTEMARDKDDMDKMWDWVKAHEAKTAPEMTVEGNHPRWNPPDQ